MLHLDEASTPNNHCIYKLLQDGDAPNDEVHIMTFIEKVGGEKVGGCAQCTNIFTKSKGK
jgi:hypothetical protein